MSIRSRKQKVKVKMHGQKQATHLKDISCTISQQLTTQSKSASITDPNNLVQRLLKLEVDLASKINALKQQKISALEDYSRQYDRYSFLSLILNSNEGKHLQEGQNQQETELIGLDQAKDELRKQERQLESLLAEMYELRTNNGLTESLLSSDQLEQLDHLIKFTYRPMNTHQLAPKSQGTLFQQVSGRTKLQYHKAGQEQHKAGLETISCMQEIKILKQMMEKMMQRKLSYLKSHQQLVARYQAESNLKVKQMLNKRLFLEKQLNSMDQALNNLKTCYNHHIQHQSLPSDHKRIQPSDNSSTKNGNQYSVEKWLKILKYRQLKQRLRQLQHQAQQEEQLPSNINSQSRVLSAQHINEESENPEHNQTLKAKIAFYQTFLQEQSLNKLQLYTQITHKQRLYQQILKQNQTMKHIISISNL